MRERNGRQALSGKTLLCDRSFNLFVQESVLSMRCHVGDHPSAVPLCQVQAFYSGVCVVRPSQSNTSRHPGLCDQQNTKRSQK